MKVNFLVDAEVETMGDDHEENVLSFKVGQEVELRVVNNSRRFDGKHFIIDKTLVDVQFPDGTTGCGLSKSWYEVVLSECDKVIRE